MPHLPFRAPARAEGDRIAAAAGPDVVLKPRMRGVLHQWAFPASVVAGVVLVLQADSARARIATVIYAVSVAALLGTSATYHRVEWRTVAARRRMRRLDHTMIFVLIAGTYTPFARLAMPRPTGYVVLAIVWGGALAGIALTLFWPTAPRWVGVPVYLLLGWVAVWFTKTIVHHAGWAATVLLAVGGALYSVGAVVYGLRRPDPWPTTFGYHEIFHACTAVAAICHYIAMWFVVF